MLSTDAHQDESLMTLPPVLPSSITASEPPVPLRGVKPEEEIPYVVPQSTPGGAPLHPGDQIAEVQARRQQIVAAGAAKEKSPVIVVPQRSVSGGFDIKFESDPFEMNLHGLLTPTEYNDAITTLNEKIKVCRSTKVDAALLVAGPLLVPLAAWGIRHSAQTRRRKRLLSEAIQTFNEANPGLLMRWNSKSTGSTLTIQRRVQDMHGPPPPQSSLSSPSEPPGRLEGGEPLLQLQGGQDSFV